MISPTGVASAWDSVMILLLDPAKVHGSARIRLVRNNLDSAALAKSASLSPSTAADPQRVVSFINVVGCGTARSSGMRQNRRQVIESATSRHSDS
jgi:hypothetical protein